jgi:hypothetical protein
MLSSSVYFFGELLWFTISDPVGQSSTTSKWWGVSPWICAWEKYITIVLWSGTHFSSQVLPTDGQQWRSGFQQVTDIYLEIICDRVKFGIKMDFGCLWVLHTLLFLTSQASFWYHFHICTIGSWVILASFWKHILERNKDDKISTTFHLGLARKKAKSTQV